MKPDWARENPGEDPREETDWARIYAPNKTDGTKFDELHANRKLGEGPVLSSKLVRGKPVNKEEATVPYAEALPAYADAAEKAVTEGAIPPEYREHVRRYFEKLK